MKNLGAFIFAGVVAVLSLIWLAVWLLCVIALGYVAYEIVFDNALNRWFG